MTESSVFSATLGLSSPWRITAVSFFDLEKKLELTVDFDHANAFCCPKCGAPAKVHDTIREIWHHNNFFHYSAFIHVRVPHLHCSGECGMTKAEPPWSREGSRFTLLGPSVPQPSVIEQIP